MSLDACAEMVRRGDPLRFRSAMAAPMPVRADLMVLYAVNLEMARASWVTEEPMIAEMRVQWWSDAVAEAFDGANARAHEVAAPLHALIGSGRIAREDLDALVAARRREARRDPFAEAAELEAYLAATGGGVMVMAAALLGADDKETGQARHLGWGAGAAGYLLALPDIEARGRPGLPPGLTASDVAAQGLRQIAMARAGGQVSRDVRPAFVAGAGAAGILAAAGPRSEARMRLAAWWTGATGRF